MQTLRLPAAAAGIIGGLGHARGCRNFESSDAPANSLPWGIVIGGEALHNNRPSRPSSAMLPVKAFEFDIGCCCIRVLQGLGLAKVRKTPRQLKLGEVRALADRNTLEAISADRCGMNAERAASRGRE